MVVVRCFVCLFNTGGALELDHMLYYMVVGG